MVWRADLFSGAKQRVKLYTYYSAMRVDSRKKLSQILDKSSLRLSGDFLPEDPLRLSLSAICRLFQTGDHAQRLCSQVEGVVARALQTPPNYCRARVNSVSGLLISVLQHNELSRAVRDWCGCWGHKHGHCSSAWWQGESLDFHLILHTY